MTFIFINFHIQHLMYIWLHLWYILIHKIIQVLIKKKGYIIQHSVF